MRLLSKDVYMFDVSEEYLLLVSKNPLNTYIEVDFHIREKDLSTDWVYCPVIVLGEKLRDIIGKGEICWEDVEQISSMADRFREKGLDEILKYLKFVEEHGIGREIIE